MKAQIYTKENCVYCEKAKETLKPFSPEIFQLDKDFSREKFFEIFPNATTYPQIIIDGEKIGGFSELEKWLAFNNPDDNF